MYELPFGHGKRVAEHGAALVDLLVGGWEMSFVGYLQSGNFLTPTISVPDPTGTRFTTAATRPDVIPSVPTS